MRGPTCCNTREKRFLKFHKSRTIGLIHLFHSEDYFEICRFLITPSEIDEYLSFREELYEKHEQELNSLSEQYVLGHFLGTTDTDKINIDYLNNLQTLLHNESEFDISFIAGLFQNRIIKIGNKDDYYFIIKEIAKLDRAELKEFKRRFKLSLEKSVAQKFTIPYRMTSIRINCGFVFIPLEFNKSTIWQKALLNLTNAHKYEQRIKKCIGMIVCHNLKEKLFEVNWCYLDDDWSYDEELEKLLKENNPFRNVSLKKSNKYFFKIIEKKNIKKLS